MKLIDKDTLIAEIERLIDRAKEVNNSSYVLLCNHLKSFIDTLEVKEVNEIDMLVSHSLTEEGLFTFKDGSQATITKIK